MMNTREEFEKNFKHLDLSKEYDGWGEYRYKHSHVDAMYSGWQACQALNDARIAELEEKIKVAKEALEHYANRKNWHKDSQQYGLYEVSDYNILYNDFYEQNQATRYAGNKAREALKTIEG